MDKETTLLTRVTANHLFLSQFEAFRATILSLRRRNPELALSILQTIVANGGKIDNVIYSPNCSSFAILAWLCCIELLRFDNATSIWSLAPDELKLRVEFLLYVQMISSRVSERVKKISHLNLSENEGVSDEAAYLCGKLNASMRVLDEIMELGLRRLKEDLMVDDDRENADCFGGRVVEEEELVGLIGVNLENADVFEALCLNIQNQVREKERDNLGLAITLRRERRAVSGEEDMSVLKWIQENVQMAHLDAMKAGLIENDIDGVARHIQYLHLDYGVAQAKYRTVFQDLLKKIISEKQGFGDAWEATREKLLLIYQEALSSNCTHLVQLIQDSQDKLLGEEIEMVKVSNNQILPPLQQLQDYVGKWKLDTNTNDHSQSLTLYASSCQRDLYHYARNAGLHVLECVMDAALSAVKKGQLEEVSYLLLLFPRLQPLVAAMGWDLLPGKTDARRKLMQLLWTSKSRVYRLEESSLYENQSDERSSVEHLCDTLCYQLDLASFVDCVNSGQPWSIKSSLFFSGHEELEVEDEDAHLDPFVENFVLERLSFQSPLRVLFDVVPAIKFEDAIKLISMQPIPSNAAAWKRMQDVELMHMRYALEYAVLALGAMEKSVTDGSEGHPQMALSFLKELRFHLEAVNNVPGKILMVNIIISLLHMDDVSPSGSPGSHFEWPQTCMGDNDDLAIDEEGNKTVGSFTELLLEILSHNLTAEHGLEDSLSSGGRQALEWRISTARSFTEDWEWRLSVLQQLLPLYEHKWRWKEALTVLRAAPSKLLNLCMQRAKYEIGEEAVHRFSLSPEDKATLALAEWVDGAFKRASVEDAVSCAIDGTTTMQAMDFSSLRSQIGPLAAILLCIDVASASARSANLAQQLLDQAQIMLSEIYPGGSPKIGSTYWNQIREIALISVARRLLKRLHELLELDNVPALQTVLSGEIAVTSSYRQGQRDRALAMLHQMVEDAHRGKRQFLSGKLHNLARAVADEEVGTDSMKGEGTYTEQKFLLDFDKDGVLGLGLRAAEQTSITLPTGDNKVQRATYDVKDTGKRFFGPLGPKPTTYLSQFILHIAAIGDIVDGTDTTHDFNYFSLVYEWPKDLVTHLVFERGSTDAAERVAEIMFADFVHEVISACVPPVYPPRSGYGWACIPLVPVGCNSSHGNKFMPSSAREVKPLHGVHYANVPGVSQYPLQLDIIKHLVKMSPVRAVLACVFGSSMLHSGSESSISGSLKNEPPHSSDVDRFFYEFALDQSERFPTLNRWIQMQTNLHRVSEFAVTSNDATDDQVKVEDKSPMKRPREHDIDTETEVDGNSIGCNIVTAVRDINTEGSADPDPLRDSLRYQVAEDEQMMFLTFDWENEEPYEKAVERLIEEGNLADALALSDRFLRHGASDQLLKLLIEHSDENHLNSERLPGYGCQSTWNNSWQYCLRLKDKQLASRLALKYLHRWEMNAALDVLTMCSCHLPQSDPLKNEVLQRQQALQRYRHILAADDHYSSWQEVEAACKEDPEGLALKLAEKGAVSAALEVAESAGLSIDLRRELHGRQLVKLLMADPLNGGGPAEASRFLSSLSGSDDALPVVMGAMQLLPNLQSKQLLVHFFLKRRDENLSDTEVSRLNSWALGLRVLSALPLPWQQRCSSLHEYPHLILEVLIMRKQLESASLILKEFPSLRDNNMILTYAAKAITVSITSASRESRISVSGPRPKQKARTGTPTKPSFTSSLSNLQKEARRAFSWAPRNAGDKTTPKETYRKRKSSGLMPPEKIAWEAMTGIREDRSSSYSADGQERLPSVSIAEEWMLTGDTKKDDAVRSSHRYDSAPDIILFKALLSLCSDESVSAKGSMDLCMEQMKRNLSSQQLPEDASMEIIGQAYHATETFVQGLLYARLLLRKLVGGSDLSNISERSRDADDASSDAGSSSFGSQATDELSELLSRADIWLRRAELLQSLLGSGIAASLDDIADQESSAFLRDRLIIDERYSMAVYTCKKCQIDAFPVWNAWGHALLRIEHYDQARVKFKQALQLCKNDPAPVIEEIIRSIESGPPVDVSAARSMYEHLARSAPTILDDSLSADSYLNVLHMPSTFPRSERSRHFQESANNSTLNVPDFDDGPRSNLDSSRYLECVNYLQEYARRQLLSFMFRHGHYKEGCLLFFPSNSVPPPPQPSSPGTSTSSSSQRSDLLATDYGTIDDLCESCVGYGAMSVLEEVLSMRMLSETSQDAITKQYTAAAVARICIYCETHKHFNYLYKFQVIKKDHVAAGLCCIQLFMNSSLQEEAVKHLEHAKMHFDEGLSTRYKVGETSKLVTKGIRGKRASEKLTEEGLVKLSARVAIQVDVVRSLNDTEGPQWKYSLFGNPNDPETFRRRCLVAEMLAEKNFDLGFQVIYEFNLPAVDIYAAVAASLAERKKGGQLTEFFRNIKGTIDDDEWDQVLGAAINIYANKHKERPDRLIDMLTSSHRKVLACVVCGRLKSAFQIASKSGSVADVQYVAHQALHANALPVLDMCKQCRRRKETVSTSCQFIAKAQSC
ncbi:hypothetical protein Nepgr_012660 [Nepenthes gracilis]|uniref:ZFYVE26-like TPR repeats domain-containing protein n=1 Tax=Nepenthes gracilis TaxID=150966 RepID=A0AAD3SHP2_NEPGR|nr:hypothetical protein Nepgr_012660 [Nepenthes gracilis]